MLHTCPILIQAEFQDLKDLRNSGLKIHTPYNLGNCSSMSSLTFTHWALAQVRQWQRTLFVFSDSLPYFRSALNVRQIFYTTSLNGLLLNSLLNSQICNPVMHISYESWQWIAQDLKSVNSLTRTVMKLYMVSISLLLKKYSWIKNIWQCECEYCMT